MLEPIKGKVYELSVERFWLLHPRTQDLIRAWVKDHGIDIEDVRGIRISTQHRVVRWSLYARDPWRRHYIVDGEPAMTEVETKLAYLPGWITMCEEHEPNPQVRTEAMEKAVAGELGTRVNIYNSDGKLIDRYEDDSALKENSDV